MSLAGVRHVAHVGVARSVGRDCQFLAFCRGSVIVMVGKSPLVA
jgi:hypothetical protein